MPRKRELLAVRAFLGKVLSLDGEKFPISRIVHHEPAADVGDVVVQIGVVLFRELAVAFVDVVPIDPFLKS